MENFLIHYFGPKVKSVEDFIERRFALVDKRYDKLRPGLSWTNFKGALVISLLIILICYSGLLLFALISSIIHTGVHYFSSTDPASKTNIIYALYHDFISHVTKPSIFELIPFIFVILNYVRHIRNLDAQYLARISQELDSVKVWRERERAEVIDEIKRQISVFPEYVRQAGNFEPLSLIKSALEPTNRELEKLIKQQSEDTSANLELLAGISGLRGRARTSLASFIGNLSRVRLPDGSVPEWKQLYVTFAINLQLDPWFTAFKKEHFVFIRDREELACYYNVRKELEQAFTQRLDADLAEILDLVNGSIFTVMYKDSFAWMNRRFVDANEDLIKRKTEQGESADLRRLFIYEDSWLTTNNERLVSILTGALWHQGKPYEARFIAKSVDFHPIILKGTNFLASCVVNNTIINMTSAPAVPSGNRGLEKNPEFRKFVYSCNSEAETVSRYKSAYSDCWNRSSSVNEFLALIERTNSAAANTARERFASNRFTSATAPDRQTYTVITPPEKAGDFGAPK